MSNSLSLDCLLPPGVIRSTGLFFCVPGNNAQSTQPWPAGVKRSPGQSRPSLSNSTATGPGVKASGVHAVPVILKVPANRLNIGGIRAAGKVGGLALTARGCLRHQRASRLPQAVRPVVAPRRSTVTPVAITVVRPLGRFRSAQPHGCVLPMPSHPVGLVPERRGEHGYSGLDSGPLRRANR